MVFFSKLIEVCVKNCGARFHQEIGKFKFLNELIKMLSTKYDGGWTSPTVKKRIIELIYSWTKGLPRETKIPEAYKMLKIQGVVTSDPVDPYNVPDPSLKRQKMIPYPRWDAAHFIFHYQDMQRPAKNSIFDEDEKSKLLARLLKSKHAEDLQAANRLIKTMVRQDEMKTEKIAKRNLDIERCCNNARLLSEMLSYYQLSSPSQDKELMKELFLSCEKMRPSLFRLASSATEEGDEGLAEILKANDELTRAIDEYRKKIGPIDQKEITDDTEEQPIERASAEAIIPAQMTPDTSASSLIDLGPHENKNVGVANSSVLDDELRALGIHDAPQNSQATPTMSDISSLSWGGGQQSFNQPTHANIGMVRPMANMQQQGVSLPGAMGSGGYPAQQYIMNQSLGMRMPQMGGVPRPVVPPIQGMPQGMVPMGMFGATRGMPPTATSPRGPAPANKRGQEALKAPTTSLDLLGQDILQNQKQQQKQKQSVSPLPQTTTATLTTDETLLSLSANSIPVNQPGKNTDMSSPPPPASSSNACATESLLSLDGDGDIAALPLTRVSSDPEPLDNLFVPLDSVLPGDHQPLTVLDRKALKIVFHFAKTTTNLSRPDVRIVVISIMSTLKNDVKNFVLQAAVPKTMRVKLQSPSGSDLPPHNPILPSAAITQVMLIANPNKETIRLKFRATYEVDGSTEVEAGEVDAFPPL
ncbi:hypothetical protein QZH41_017481 [Actinostola sp. cb2023]|nr:hypothetical protein QZH41_017481 [Actinostola sp. cb2023]